MSLPITVHFLGRGEAPYTALDEDEASWVQQLKGANGETGLSFIRVADDGSVSVLSGLLEGMKGQIKRFNLHKRVAEVELPLMGQTVAIYMGVEIVR